MYETEGPIQWTAIQRWCEVHELDEDQREDMFVFLEALDGVYLEYKSKKLREMYKKG